MDENPDLTAKCFLARRRNICTHILEAIDTAAPHQCPCPMFKLMANIRKLAAYSGRFKQVSGILVTTLALEFGASVRYNRGSNLGL